MKKKYGLIITSVAISILLLVQGYQAFVIECLKHEIGVLRNQNDASRSDIKNMRKKYVDLADIISLQSGGDPFVASKIKEMLTKDLPAPAPVNIMKPKRSLFQRIKDRLMGLVWEKPELALSTGS